MRENYLKIILNIISDRILHRFHLQQSTHFFSKKKKKTVNSFPNQLHDHIHFIHKLLPLLHFTCSSHSPHWFINLPCNFHFILCNESLKAWLAPPFQIQHQQPSRFSPQRSSNQAFRNRSASTIEQGLFRQTLGFRCQNPKP